MHSIWKEKNTEMYNLSLRQPVWVEIKVDHEKDVDALEDAKLRLGKNENLFVIRGNDTYSKIHIDFLDDSDHLKFRELKNIKDLVNMDMVLIVSVTVK